MTPASKTPPQGTGLWQVARPAIARHRWKLILVLASMPVSAGLAMMVPYLTKVAIDEYIIPAAALGDPSAVLVPLARLTALAGVLVVGGYMADALYVSLLQRAGISILQDMRETLFQRTLRLPRSYFDTHPIGSILTRITSDFEALGEGLGSGVLSMFMDLLKVLVYLGAMFWLDWRLTLTVLVMGPVLVVLIRFFQGRVRTYFFKARQSLSDATGFLQEALQGMKTVQLFGQEQKVYDRFIEKNHRFFIAQNQSNLYDALLYSLVEGVTTLALAMLLWVASGELLAGMLTLGVLVAFLEYIQRLFVPLKEFSQQVAVLQRGRAALDHIGDLFQVPLDPAESLPPQAVWDAPPQAAEEELPPPETVEELAFSDVSFAYSPQGEEVLKGVSFAVKRGQTLAIVGATGSGKSTVIRLLTRAYSGYGGHITLNGQELSGVSADRLARMVSVVHQNVFCFQGSVAFNISLGRPGITPAMIEQAARYVHAHEFITRLEGGYDFVITQGGGNLSSGQAQLIAFARAILARTELIILDEATASVDSFTEQLIQKALNRLYEDKTIIAIAHRLSTIRHADTILVLDKGHVVESGDHQSLIAKGGLYAGLVGRLESTAPPPEGGAV
ncbi:MAG: ABC transporter ATP-binding protein/permease [Deltaproteobacteria bacterium]|nr:ABC transporter ATP-binding protein/permease [Deltaproteobacteria bacterium]